jgi:hypothetical protein
MITEFDSDPVIEYSLESDESVVDGVLTALLEIGVLEPVPTDETVQDWIDLDALATTVDSAEGTIQLCVEFRDQNIVVTNNTIRLY